MTEIEIHSETFQVHKFRRNYKRCRVCRARTGTVIYSSIPVPVTLNAYIVDDLSYDKSTVTESFKLVVICEKCGRRWVPTTGVTLRALGM